MAFQKFTPNILGFVSSINQQSHNINNSHLQQWLPIFPLGGFPVLQFTATQSQLSTFVVEVYDLNNNLIASQIPTNTTLFNILDNVPNLVDENDPYTVFTSKSADWGLNEGCYYICFSYTQNNEVCRYYTNAFQVVDRCLHYIEFSNNCNVDNVFYQNSIYKPRIYFDGNIDLKEQTRREIERELLLNGCYRTDTAQIFKEYYFNKTLMLSNTLRALSWAFGHDNIKFVCGNGIQIPMQNPQINEENQVTKKQNLYNVSFFFEAQFINPQGCCEDYAINGISFEPLQKPNEDCNICIIEAVQISATCDSVTISIASDYPVSITIDNNLIESNYTGTSYTFENLSPESTGTIDLQSQCGSTYLTYQTNPNTLVITATPIDIQCGDNTGNVNINVTGITGAYLVTVCDSLNNELFTTTNIQNKGWIDTSLLIAGTYTVKVSDENCTQQTTFEIQQACVCDYDYQLSSTNCSCDNLGSIYIDVVQWTIGTGDWEIALCDSNNNIVDTTDVAPFTFTGLLADTYTLKLTETNPNCLLTKIVVIADTCECTAPDEGQVIYSNGTIIFPDTGADQYALIITPIAGNGNITITDTINNPSPDDDGFLSYGNRDIVCGTTYQVKIIAKCSIGQKNKTAETGWVLFETEDCPPCGEQDLDIVINLAINGQFQAQGVPINAPGSIVEYSSDGTNWSTISPFLSQINCFSINGFSAANSNFYVFDDPNNSNNHCIAFELGSGVIDPLVLAELQNCNAILRLQLIGYPYIFVLDPSLAIVTQPVSNAVHISYPKQPQTKYKSQTTIDLLNNLSTGTTPSVVQTASTLQFRCCYLSSYLAFVRLTYLDCSQIGKCVFVFSDTDYNIEDVNLDANGNVV